MAGIREQTARNALVNLSGAILRFEGTLANVKVSDEALRVWEAKVNEVLPQTYQRIYERKESQAGSDFTKGLMTVSGSAIRYAVNEGRTTVSGSDIENAVKSSFCHVWPFCK
jgi:hypothetical protein